MPLPDTVPTPPGAPTDIIAAAEAPEAERWRVDTSQAAEWVMRKLARAHARLADLDAERAEYLAQIDAWYADASRGERATADWAHAQLADWAIRQREADPDIKTLHLPSGRVATRLNPTRPKVLEPSDLAVSLGRMRHPAYDAIIKPRIDVDVRALVAGTQLAEVLSVRLACGCTARVLRTEPDWAPQPGTEWPVRAGDHRPDCPSPEHPQLVEWWSVEPTPVLVAIVPDDEGTPRVHVVEGVQLVPGTVTASVQPT